MANLLIHQKALNVRPLIPTQLNNLPHLLINLYRPITGEVLLERFADSFDVKVVGEAGDGCDTFTAVTLLDADMDFFFALGVAVRSVVKGVEAEGVGGDYGGLGLGRVVRIKESPKNESSMRRGKAPVMLVDICAINDLNHHRIINKHETLTGLDPPHAPPLLTLYAAGPGKISTNDFTPSGIRSAAPNVAIHNPSPPVPAKSERRPSTTLFSIPSPPMVEPSQPKTI